MAGVLSFHGCHGLWSERPGVHNLHTVSDFVEAIAKETNNFKRPPLKTRRQEAERWALANCSYGQFLTEWKEILRHANSKQLP